MSILGMDTDGWQIGTSELTLEAMVKPELRKEYDIAKDKWLIPDSGSNKEFCMFIYPK